MKKYWKIITIALVALFVMGLAVGCGGNDQAAETGGEKADKPVTLRVGHTVQEDTALHKGALKFAEIVDEKSDGQIKVEVFAASAMGGNRELIESLQAGSLDFALPAMGVLGGFTDKTAIFDLPYLFKNDEEAEKILDGEIGQDIFEQIEETGLKGLAYWTQGWRNLTTGDVAVDSPEKIKGLKIRTMEVPLHMEHFNTIGASAVPMAFSEVYTSLQQGVIDGQENPYVNIYLMGFYEVQEYITETQHIYDPVPMLMSLVTWDKLSPERQQIVKEAAEEVKAWEREEARKDKAKYKEVIEGTGQNQIIELTDAQRAKFRDAAQPVYDNFKDQALLKELQKALGR